MTVARVLEELDRHLVALFFDVNPKFHLLASTRSLSARSIGSKKCESHVSTRRRAYPTAQTQPALPQSGGSRRVPLTPPLQRQPGLPGGPRGFVFRRS